jgi:signal transduction histidine kinase
MKIFEITALTATLFNVVLTSLVLSRDLRSALHRVYLLWGVSVTLWNVGAFYMYNRQITEEQAFIWAKVLQLGVIFMPISLFHLCVLISQTRVAGLLPALYAVHIGFAATLFKGWFITGVRLIPDVGWWSKPGPAFWFFICFYVVITTALVLILYEKQQHVPPIHRTRLRALLLAIIGLWIFGTNDLLPIMGFDYYPGTQVSFFPLGNLAAVFYVVIVGYGVLQHQLLDVHVTLSRFAAQFVRLLFMFLIGLILLLIIASVVPDQFTAFSFFAAVGVLLLSAIVASFFFPQFFGKGTDALERQILGDRFEYHTRVQNLIHTMRSFPEPHILLEELQALLVNTMRVRSYQIILLDETTRGFNLFYSHPSRPQVQLSDFQTESPIFRFFQQGGATYLSCNIAYQTNHETSLERSAREQLKTFEPELCFPFLSGSELVGLMLLGPKVNGDIFTPHDLRLLLELVRNLGLLLNQIRLRNQLQVAHEQDLLGRMSRGLAHDLNNLLTPVQTLLQLFQGSTPRRDAVEDLLPMALRNIDTVRSYVNEALFFSRDPALQAKPGSLVETISEAIELVRPSAQAKEVQIRTENLPDVTIEMDSVLIKRLACNLLSNAIDASPRSSEIIIRLSHLPKTELSREWFRLQIIDVGEGISPENLKRVFTPYFTTKNTGDGRRGFGLGLAIARKIVHLHGGNLSIASKEKKGTTVQVDLPSRQTNSRIRHSEFMQAIQA